jgi:hypothetical protein
LRVALGRALKIPEQPSFPKWSISGLELLFANAGSQGMGYIVADNFPFAP